MPVTRVARCVLGQYILAKQLLYLGESVSRRVDVFQARDWLRGDFMIKQGMSPLERLSSRMLAVPSKFLGGSRLLRLTAATAVSGHSARCI